MQESKKWQQSWRAKQDIGKWYYIKRSWYFGNQLFGISSMIYYLNNYRSNNLSLIQRNGLIISGFAYILRDLLAFFYTQSNKSIKREDMINIVIGNIIFWIPAYFANNDANNSLQYNQIIYYSSLILQITGHIFNSLSELQRKWWLQKPGNKDKVYTQGFFSITRHPNYFGDLLFMTGWGLLTFNWKVLGLPLLSLFSFYNEYIPEIETFMEGKFGDEWIEYKKNVKSSLIPFTYF
mmetsp:Transcript_59192/g.72391  ORF Transcript_59192/g.72391 Transcript_59192/m.72391 type:complete len:236 (+) Transcript_59192:24-731(+)